jgi:dGTPase
MGKRVHYNYYNDYPGYRETRDCLATIKTRNDEAWRRYPAREEGDDSDPFKLDMERIITSPAIYRLTKTQVMPPLLTLGIPITRDKHSIQIAQYGMVAGGHLGLNIDLCIAGGYGHDVGQVPKGHDAESHFRILTGTKVSHATLGTIILQRVENGGKGYNLTHQTLECIASHSRADGPLFVGNVIPEATLTMYLDKICYTFADTDNFSDAKVVIDPETRKQIRRRMNWFGATTDERIRTCIVALCLESAGRGRVSFECSETAQRLFKLKDFLYRNVYYLKEGAGKDHPRAKRLDQIKKETEILYDRFSRLVPDCNPVILISLLDDLSAHRLVEITSDAGFLAMIAEMPLAKYLPTLRGKKFDLTNPDLDW